MTAGASAEWLPKNNAPIIADRGEKGINVLPYEAHLAGTSPLVGNFLQHSAQIKALLERHSVLHKKRDDRDGELELLLKIEVLV